MTSAGSSYQTRCPPLAALFVHPSSIPDMCPNSSNSARGFQTARRNGWRGQSSTLTASPLPIEGYHIHDADPRFQAWNEIADTFQMAPPIVTGGEVIVSAGEG